MTYKNLKIGTRGFNKNNKGLANLITDNNVLRKKIAVLKFQQEMEKKKIAILKKDLKQPKLGD